ncbi:MAG: hypothetical protein ACE5EG_04055 [Thermoanaerobaculia bacterium]
MSPPAETGDSGLAASAMPTRAATRGDLPKQHQLGVLFVHGIGRQALGGTLIRWGDAVADWIGRWGRTADGARVTARVEQAVLDEDSSAPPHAELRISVDKASSQEIDVDEHTTVASSWLLVESWWAESFATPTFGQLVTWSFQTVPWAISIHFARRVQHARSRVIEATSWRTRLLRLIELFAGSVSGLVAGLLLSPLILVLLLLLLVLGVLPIPQVRSFVANVQRSLAGSIGDSLVLLESPVQAAAIRTKLGRAIAWMADSCERLVVVAHSQGAAIAVDALAADPAAARGGAHEHPCEIDTLVTFGSGVTKLAFLQSVRSRPRKDVEDSFRQAVAPPDEEETAEEDEPAEKPLSTPNPWAASVTLLLLVAMSLILWARFSTGELVPSDLLTPLALISGTFLVMGFAPILLTLLMLPLGLIQLAVQTDRTEESTIRSVGSSVRRFLSSWPTMFREGFRSLREQIRTDPETRLGCLGYVVTLPTFLIVTMLATKYVAGFPRVLAVFLGTLAVLMIVPQVALWAVAVWATLRQREVSFADSKKARWGCIGLFLAAFAVMAGLTITLLGSRTLLFLVYLLPLFAVAYVWQIVKWVAAETDRLEVRVHDGVADWIDFYSSADPVPNGPTPGIDAARPRSFEIVNAASILRDHTIYWKNVEQFVAPLVAGLASLAGGPLAGSAEQQQLLQEAQTRRRRRVGALKLSRWLVLAGTVVYLAVRWPRMVDLGATVLTATRSLLEALPFALSRWLPEDPQALTAASWGLVVVLVWCSLAYGLVLISWQLWDAHDRGRFRERASFAAWPIAVWIAGLGAAAALTWLVDSRIV